MRIYF